MRRISVMLPDLSEIKERRKQLGLTQAQLAILSGVSQSLVTKVESGKLVPSYENAKRLFDALESREIEGTTKAHEIMSEKVVNVLPSAKVSSAIKLMRKHSISQIPVVENGVVVGSFSEKLIVGRLHAGDNAAQLGEQEVKGVMGEAMPIIQPNAPLSLVNSLLEYNSAVLVSKNGKIRGIITKADLLGIMIKGAKGHKTGQNREKH